MNRSVPVVFLASLAITIPRLASAQVSPRVVRPDVRVAPRTFWRDSLALRIGLHGGTLEVRAERSRTNPILTTGKYVVRWNGQQIAVEDHESVTAGAPVVAGIFPGNPTVVALSTHTGGQGSPSYYVKLILLEPGQQLGSVAVRAYSLGATEQVSSDDFFMTEGPEDGAFELDAGDFTLTYSGGALQLGPAEEQTATPVSEPESVHVASMKSDLRNLVTAQEAYFADSVKYASRPEQLKYSLTKGNRWVRFQVTADGHYAVIGNANTATVCAIFVGSTAIAPATKEGQPACR